VFFGIPPESMAAFRTLRELGLGLDVVQAVLTRASTPAQVAAAHVAVLDAQIRALRLRRAVLSMVAAHGNTIEETLLMNRLARLSAQERQQMIDDFVDGAFEGIDPDAPGAGIARGMRQLPAELPEDPAPEQVRAWVELAELIADRDFQHRVRAMALAGAQAAQASARAGQAGAQATRRQPGLDHQAVAEHAGQALAQGIAPGSPRARQVLDRIIPPRTPAAERAQLLEHLETFTDTRVERYWRLLAVVNGQQPPPPAVPAFDWLIAALRADLATRDARDARDARSS
jgi:hypothetical protein